MLDKNIQDVYTGPADQKQVDVSIEVQGFMSGSGSRLTTGPVVLPLFIFRSENTVTCPDDNFQLRDKACAATGDCCAYVGQAGGAPSCCPGAAASCKL